MAITYNPATAIITVVGYTVGTPCNFTDLYNADKAGSLSLHARTGISAVDGAGVAVDRALRPADYVVLGGTNGQDLYIVVANWTNMTTATIHITGTDRDDQAQTEDIVVTANGTYYTTKWFKTVTHTEVTVFTKSDAGSFDYDLTQGQWGVIWNEGANFIISGTIICVGDASTSTYFADVSKNVLFTNTNLRYCFYKTKYAHIQFGQLEDATKKITSRGVNFLVNESTGYGRFIYRSGTEDSGDYIYLYSTSVREIYADATPYGTDYTVIGNFPTTPVRIWNCFFDKVFPDGLYNVDIFNLTILRGVYGVNNCDGTFNTLTVNHCAYMIAFNGSVSRTMKNLYMRSDDASSGIRWTGGGTNPQYLINVDWDAWLILWHYSPYADIFRQYEFDAKCIDLNGNPIQGVTALAEYISPYGTAFTDTTDAAGEITTQTVDHGFFDQPHGSTEQLKTPLKVTYSKPGWQTVIKHYDMDEVVKDVVKMTRVVDIVLVRGRPALNLDEDNPESEEYMII